MKTHEWNGVAAFVIPPSVMAMELSAKIVQSSFVLDQSLKNVQEVTIMDYFGGFGQRRSEQGIGLNRGVNE
jgi:hypothetical protein